MRQDENTAILSRSFGAVADDYNRLRSGPSPTALDWLLPANANDVLEIGAGTGILTRLLTERVGLVTAVEPDERMRAVLAASDPLIEVLAGQAEEIPAGSSSVDVVIAQSAWHWVRRVARHTRSGEGSASRRTALPRVDGTRSLRRLDAVTLGGRHHLQPGRRRATRMDAGNAGTWSAWMPVEPALSSSPRRSCSSGPDRCPK